MDMSGADKMTYFTANKPVNNGSYTDLALGGRTILSGDDHSFTYASSNPFQIIRVLGSGFTYQDGHAVAGTPTALIGTTEGQIDFEVRLFGESIATFNALSPADQITYMFRGDDYIATSNQKTAPTSDVVYGGSGNDTISGGQGSDTLDGGASDDTVLLGFKRGEARVSHDADNRLVIDGPNGMHKVLTGFEHFQFTDGTVNDANFTFGKAAVRDTFRFFDTHDGGHFFTTSTVERDQVLATRPDLKPEGVGFEAFDGAQVAGTAPVFRFFDTKNGGHFFTINTAERDQVLATRPDLKPEGVGFYEFQAGQGDSTDAVYRFFDTHDGGHFFTTSTTERDQVLATRPDMHLEGIAFYAPHQGVDFLI